MFANSQDSQPSEHVSTLALELLDDIWIRLMECTLVLAALPDEADMNFAELDQELQSVQRTVRQAYEAASLVHQGARLHARWGNGWSRPTAIFARHSAATRDGAPRVDPRPGLGDGLERWLWQLPAADGADRAPDVRPRCTGTLRATKQPCTSTAIYLGSRVFAAHCYSHATPAERGRYRAHQDMMSALQSTAYDELLGRQHDLGEQLSVQWLQGRESRRKWVSEVLAAGRASRDERGGGDELAP